MKDVKLCGVYQIRNTINGKLYVGSTARGFRWRWGQHVSALNKQQHSNQKLQNAWNKYGETAFIFEILVCCPEELCLHFEQVVMDKLNVVACGYNIAPVAGSRRGVKQSIDSKTKLKATLASRTPNQKLAIGEKLAASLRGKTLSATHKANISAGCLGVPKPRVNDIMLEHKGKTQTMSMWVTETGVPREVMNDRLKSGWTISETLSVPVRKYRKSSTMQLTHESNQCQYQ
jgi:group I intron endonuclease